MRKESSSGESDINNNKQVNVEMDAASESELTESEDRQTEKTRKIRKFKMEWYL